MVKQNDLAFRKEIQLYGCNLLCHLAMVRMSWSVSEVEEVYRKALAQGILTKDCGVENPNALLQLAGSKQEQLGGIVIATGESWGLAEDNPRIRYKVARWRERNSSYQHFTLFNNYSECYDPYDANLATYRLEKLENIGYQLYG